MSTIEILEQWNGLADGSPAKFILLRNGAKYHVRIDQANPSGIFTTFQTLAFENEELARNNATFLKIITKFEEIAWLLRKKLL